MMKTKKNWSKTGLGPSTIKLDDEHTAIIDRIFIPFLQQYKWIAVKSGRSWYARLNQTRDGRQFSISMHRLIANTPEDMVCHHRNRNSLDNRRANLVNLTKTEHEALHMNDTLIIKYDPKFNPSSPPTRT